LVYQKPVKPIWTDFSDFHKNRSIFNRFFNLCVGGVSLNASFLTIAAEAVHSSTACYLYLLPIGHKMRSSGANVLFFVHNHRRPSMV
jgi:hypothetical protein